MMNPGEKQEAPAENVNDSFYPNFCSIAVT